MTGPPAAQVPRGALDTSVVISLEQLPLAALPAEPAIAAVTLAELAAGPHATDDPRERARRQDRLQRIETLLDPLPFDNRARRASGSPTSHMKTGSSWNALARVRLMVATSDGVALLIVMVVIAPPVISAGSRSRVAQAPF